MVASVSKNYKSLLFYTIFVKQFFTPSPAMKYFDTIVVGKGLIGSSAAKYLCQSKENVALIGPDEPANGYNATVYASHYDQARIQRVIGKDNIWTSLNLHSALRYNELEEESGIRFHSGVGCLYVNPHGTDDYLEQAPAQAKLFSLQLEHFNDGNGINKRFPDFNFPGISKGIFESAPAGFINPRLLIQTQLKIFEKNNGTVFNDVVTMISHKNNDYEVTCHTGEYYYAKNVLLCPGAFINFFNLIENKLAVTLKSESTIWTKVDEEEARRLSALPSLIYEMNSSQISNIYLIQPVLYPDGNYYLKMGANLPQDVYFENISDVNEWFVNGKSDLNLPALKKALETIIPGLNVKQILTKRCIVSFTAHRKPYVGKMDDNRLFVACGGNGYSAMCSDALGNLASQLVTTDMFPRGYSFESFKPVFVNE